MRDDDETDEFDDDADADAWNETDDDDATMPCPYCGRPIYDDAERCPACGQYLSDAERPTTNQPRWVVVVALILLGAFLFALLR